MSYGFYKVMERRTSRVKSTTFHPKKPVVIVAQHDGVIQAYDYQLDVLIHEFRDHVGPVRSVVYHPLLNMFASGGDDIKIRMWDYSTKRVISVLEGHRDYVRSLDFHPHQPYLLSTSDDQTVRIWNFQSKKLLATLTGHTHYVMCGRFFLEEYIVSCSLDQTIRVWDYRNINEKKSSILSLPSVYVKQILDGHDKGINCISVCKNLFATASDDKEAKVWELEGGTVYEKEAFYHHQNIVSSVLLLEDHLISNGEDGMLAVYTFAKKATRKFLIEDRFWCIAGHGDYYCVGHDAGFYVFSLKNPAKAFCYDKGVYHVADRMVYFNDLCKLEEKVFLAKKEVVSMQKAASGQDTHCHQQHQERGHLLVQYESSFDLLNGRGVVLSQKGTGLLFENYIVVKKGACLYPIDCYGNVLGENVECSYDRVFRASGHLVGVRGSILFLVSLDGYRVVCTKSINFEARDVVAGDAYIAAIGRNRIHLLDYSLETISAVQEIAPINSGFFWEDTFFYSTTRQIKFLNSDSGILKSTDGAFVFHMEGDTMYYLGDGIVSVTVDLTEFRFKRAVRGRKGSEGAKGCDEHARNDALIKSIIESGDLPGLSPLAFLIRNRRGDIALPYVSSPRQRFELCMSNGKYHESLEICEEMDDDALFRRLANESLRDCCVDVAERCFVRLGDEQGLFMLYVCSKQDEKIRDLYKRASAGTKVGIAKYLKDDEFVKSALECDMHCTREAGGKSLDAGSGDKDARREEEHSDADFIYSRELMESKKEFVSSDLDWEEAFREGLNFTTEGKFNQALKLFRRVLYSKIDDESVRKRVGAYISGLSVEKKRRKIVDPKTCIEMSLYFSSLGLEDVHKALALRSAMLVLFRNGNYSGAKKIARNLKVNVKEVLEHDSDEDRFEVGGGVFCYDVLGFRDRGKLCRVCYSYSATGDICRCCEVGILN